METTALAIAIVACVSPHALGDAYYFESERVPAAGGFEGRFLFYVHSREDSPGPAAASPVMTFAKFKLVAVRGKAAPKTDVVVGVVPWKDFDDLKPTPFCRFALSERHVVMHARDWYVVRSVDFVRGGTFTLRRSGPYILFVANCGSPDAHERDLYKHGAVLMSGMVKLKNPYGFIAGNSYFKSWVYTRAALVHVLGLLGWSAVLCHYSDIGRRKIHTHITIILVAACLENGLYFAYVRWADKVVSSGDGFGLLTTAAVVTVVKQAYFLLMYRLAATEDPTTLEQAKLAAAMSLYVLAALPKVCVLWFRHQVFISDFAYAGMVLPSALMGLRSLVWTIRGLEDRMEHCGRTGDDRMVSLYRRTADVAVLLALLSSVAFWAQYFDKPGQDASTWYHHVLIEDAAPQAVAFVAIAATACVWWPPRAAGRSWKAAGAEAGGLGRAGDRAPPACLGQLGPGHESAGCSDDDDAALNKRVVPRTIGSSTLRRWIAEE